MKCEASFFHASRILTRIDELPEEPYPQPIWDAKVDQVWDFVLRRYSSARDCVKLDRLIAI